MSAKKYEVINIRTVMNKDTAYGGLSFFEGERDIPFAIKRVYCIFETEAELHRGFHAHKLNQQLLFCPFGEVEIIIDDGTGKEKVLLDHPSKGLILYPGLWREMVWKQNKSVLCVAASEYYDPNEYIRDYGEFLTYVSDRDREEKRNIMVEG